MNIPHNLLDLLDIVEGITSKFTRNNRAHDPEAETEKRGTVRQRYAKEAWDRYDNIVGRFDVSNRVPARELTNVLVEDVETLTKLGARYDVESKMWKVPESIADLDPFKAWWPEVAPDLLDKTPRMLMTKNGRRIEGYVLGEDSYHGSDSTATPIMYAALPIIAALAWCLWPISTVAALLSTLLAIPFITALGQGEGPIEAVKATLLLLLFPLVGSLVLGSSRLGSFSTAAYNSLLNTDLSVVLRGAGAAMVLLPVFVLIWGFIFEDEATGAGFDTFFERVKDAFKWSAVLVAFGLVVSFLPAYMAPVYCFVMACMYPMVYSEKNFKARNAELKEQGELYNLGTQGALTNAHVEARATQALNAYKDNSPLINIGKALGHLTAKHYAYAPDAMADMSISCMDLTMHFLGFGTTGTGKTASGARNILLQYKKSRWGGALVRCGKGSLAGEVRGIIDIMVEPGMKFAYMEGLDAEQLAIALKSVGSKPGAHTAAIWNNTAELFIDHLTVILEALHKHEKSYKQIAVAKARTLENNIAYQEAELIKLQKRNQDASNVQREIVRLKQEMEHWTQMFTAETKWRWNVDTLVRLKIIMNSPVEQSKGIWVAGREFQNAAHFLGVDDDPRRAIEAPGTIHPDLGKGSLLDDSLNYALKVWPNTGEQRTSYMANVDDKLNPLMRGKHLRDENGTSWALLETGVDVGQALYGKFVGINLPTDIHGRAAAIVQALVRQRIYSGVVKRSEFGELWQEKLPGQMPIMDLCDECQLIVSEEEKSMAPVARSRGMMMVYFTQGYESLEGRFEKSAHTFEFANSFKSIFALQSSAQTYEYLKARFGTALMVRFPKATVGLDYSGGIENAIHSPLSDLNHPGRSLMRKLERMGAGRLVGMSDDDDNEFHGQQVRSRKASAIKKTIKIPSGGVKEIMPVFLPEEYSALLNQRGRAVVWLHRAAAPRVDVAQLNYVPESAMRDLDPAEV